MLSFRNGLSFPLETFSQRSGEREFCSHRRDQVSASRKCRRGHQDIGWTSVMGDPPRSCEAESALSSIK